MRNNNQGNNMNKGNNHDRNTFNYNEPIINPARSAVPRKITTVLITTILVLVVFILALVVFGGMFVYREIKNNEANKTEQKVVVTQSDASTKTEENALDKQTETPIKTEENTSHKQTETKPDAEKSNEVVTPPASPEAKTDEFDESKYFGNYWGIGYESSAADIENYIRNFTRPMCNGINNNIKNYTKQYMDGETCWFDELGCVKKEVAAGTDGYAPVRQYFYEPVSGNLVFAYMVEKSGDKHRLYFSGNNLIRYIDPSSTTINNPTATEVWEMAEWAMYEAY